MGFANVRAGTRVLMLVLVQACGKDSACTAIVVPTGGGKHPDGPPGTLGDDVLLDGLIKAVDADGFNGAPPPPGNTKGYSREYLSRYGIRSCSGGYLVPARA